MRQAIWSAREGNFVWVSGENVSSDLSTGVEKTLGSCRAPGRGCRRRRRSQWWDRPPRSPLGRENVSGELQHYILTIVPYHWPGTMCSMVHQHWCSSRDPRSSSCDPSCTCSPCTAGRCRASGKYWGSEHSPLHRSLSVVRNGNI